MDELQLEVFEEESICIEGLYPTPGMPAGPRSDAIKLGSVLATGNLVSMGEPSLVNWLI